jgi:putative tryptophan/tyrosine transport system substrate-binding protein
MRQRPGANVTGLFFQHLELVAKRFGLFKEMLPVVRRVAVFFDALSADQLKQVAASNQSVGFKLQSIHLENPPYDFESAFRAARRTDAEAIFVLESASIFRGRELMRNSLRKIGCRPASHSGSMSKWVASSPTA